MNYLFISSSMSTPSAQSPLPPPPGHPGPAPDPDSPGWGVWEEAAQRYWAFRAVMKDAASKAIKDSLVSRYKHAIREGRYDVLAPLVGGSDLDALSALTIMDPPRVGRPNESAVDWFVTINGSPEVDPVKFWGQVTKRFSSKGNVAELWATIEQRATVEDPAPHGWHIHLLLRLENPWSKSVVLQQTYQCFTRYVGQRTAIDVRRADWERHMEYMRGQKASEKIPRVDRDKIERARLGLPQVVPVQLR